MLDSCNGKEGRAWLLLLQLFTRPLKIDALTIRSHAAGQALLETTILTSVPVVLRYFALHRATTLVAELFPDRSLEEALAALTAYRSVVAATGPISTHQTQFHVHWDVVRVGFQVH